MPEPVNERRTYDGSKRRAAAQRTRLAILDAARELFSTLGYAQTSVQAVAARAEVSVDTVYATVGRKPRLLLEVHDMALAEGPAPVPATQRGYVEALRRADTAEEKLEIYAAAMGRVLPRTVPLMLALREAGRTDPACAAEYDALSERRAANMRLFAHDLRETGQLRSELTDEEVADLIWSLNSPEWFTLTTSRGRTPEQYAELLADLLIRTLLETPSPRTGAR